MESPLLFIEFFGVVANPMDDQEGVGLYKVQCPLYMEDIPSIYHAVVSMTDVVQLVKLIPVFETKISGAEVSSENCLHAYQEYYVNSFTDKETYNVLRTT